MSATRTHDSMAGAMLGGRYEVLGQVGRGGMAMVYKAHDHRLGRDCAIKILHEGLSGDATFTTKFSREARNAARLTHHNVVAVFDQGVEDERPYIVMEFVPGSTLRRLITAQAPLPPLQALQLMEPVLAALSAAHSVGLVHRDVKPENVLISERGEVKVADFGLARAITGDTATATQGVVMGTVSYIPPELVQQGRGDARSDVYSAGIVLFELLTGRKPHQGDSAIQVAYAHCNKDIPAPSTFSSVSWRESRQGIPPYVDALVQAATARDPELRPRDAGVMLSHLRLAAHSLDRGIMNDHRLDVEMRRTGDEDDEPYRPPTPYSPGSAPTTIVPAPASRWVHADRPQRTTPSTPISPIDLPRATDAVAVPFYDRVRKSVAPAQPLSAPLRRLGRLRPEHRQLPRTGSSVTHQATRRLPSRRWAPLMALLSVLLIAGSVGYTSWYLLAGQFTSVPAAVGLTADDARAAAARTHTRVSFVEEFSETVPAGTVIRTQPEAGSRVQNNAEFTATVSRGPERFDVPALTGLTLEAARGALAKANLELGRVTERWSETVAGGTVVSASTEAGTDVKRGTAVDLVVSKGPKPISVVSYIGKDAKAAQAALVRAGLTVSLREQNHDTVPAGQVIAQDPERGEQKKGDTVVLTVSKGPVMVVVPNTRQMKTAEATALLTKSGFKVTVSTIPNPAPLDAVAYSTPAAASQAPKGSTVTIYVA